MPRKKKVKPIGLLHEINNGKEVLRIHRNERGIFLTFGAETVKGSQMYEMEVSEENVASLKKEVAKL